MLDSCGGGLAFWATGFAFAYGGDDDGPKTFIGNTNFFLRNDDVQFEQWFFQFAFACALSSIVAGTIAERTKMTAYLLYSVVLAGFVYPVVSRVRTIIEWWFFLSSGQEGFFWFEIDNVSFFKIRFHVCMMYRSHMPSGRRMDSFRIQPLIRCGVRVQSIWRDLVQCTWLVVSLPWSLPSS